MGVADYPTWDEFITTSFAARHEWPLVAPETPSFMACEIAARFVSVRPPRGSGAGYRGGGVKTGHRCRRRGAIWYAECRKEALW